MPDEIANQAGAPARVDYCDDNGALCFNEIVSRKIASWNESPTVVIELDREDLGIERNLVSDGKVVLQEFLTQPDRPRFEIVIRGLDVIADNLQRDDRQSFYRRRMVFFSSAIVRVFDLPRV